MADDIIKANLRSWFCVWNNPQETLTDIHEPSEIAEKALELWLQDKPTRTGAVAYCISADGLIHLHMVLEDSNKARFSALKKAFPKAHLEPTRGTKEQAEDYINKKGKFEEKGEKVIYVAKFGEIKGNQGQRKDFEVLEHLINEGKTPNEIFDMNFAYRRYEKLIKDAYYRKREKETKFVRDIKVYWHVGLSGSGKSYVANQLIEEHGEESLYFVSDYENGGLDRYNGQEILFLDEFRGQIRYSTLLAMLQGYKQQFHARYANITGLWTEVHITSVLPPELVYSNMVSEHKEYDTIKQLLRRITKIIYHYKEDDIYKVYEESTDTYTDYDGMRRRMLDKTDFIPVQGELPFN